MNATAAATLRASRLEGHIRRAYITLAGGQWGNWVNLTSLRVFLDYTAEEVDEELRRLERTPYVHLVPEADQKLLTGEDRKAAVLIGGTAKHLIAIEQ